ncbi:MAG TPA: hypothetical protein VG456_04200 [Candidatus Sulfopaludibacter sp.]|jgi:hypothetical protein|nr:hypothetical protein [Candidatus Sulfopaludibacter sp.]
MSFLDNLENSLKSLESQEEGKESAQRLHKERESQRASAQAAAPQAEILKKGPYTAELLKQATRVGHSLRVMVRATWIGTSLRLEARDQKLELRPTASGILAVYLKENREVSSAPLDLTGSPEQLLRTWLE